MLCFQQFYFSFTLRLVLGPTLVLPDVKRVHVCFIQLILDPVRQLTLWTFFVLQEGFCVQSKNASLLHSPTKAFVGWKPSGSWLTSETGSCSQMSPHIWLWARLVHYQSMEGHCGVPGSHQWRGYRLAEVQKAL